MELNDLLLLLNYNDGFDGNALASAFLEIDANTFNYYAEYDPLQHNVHNTSLRQDKFIKKPDPLSDDPTKLVTDTVKVARISIPLQKYIVKLRAQFLVGNPITLDCSPVTAQEKNMLEGVQKLWDDNKLDYKSKFIAKILFSECECAEIWYADPNDNNYWQGTSLENVVRQSPEGETITDGTVPIKWRIRVIAKSLGDVLYPMFDASGDMIAFGRGYSIGTTEHLDIYTQNFIHQGTKQNADQSWNFNEPLSHGFGKIPVIYYAQDQPEWFDVQPMINRLETLLSNNADTNDYFGSPTAVASGNILSYADKGESGKMVQLENGAKMEYLTWDAVPGNIKMEVETLMKLIYGMTSTPDISFEQMKGLGHFSGIALKMLFMAAHMEASDKEEIFGEAVQRRINLLKQFIGGVAAVGLKPALNMRIKPKFTYYLPNDDTEVIANIKTSLDAGIISTDSAIRLNPIVQDGDAEIKAIKKEDKTKKQQQPAPIITKNQPQPLTIAQ